MANNSGAPVKDARFQKVHNDPRFARNSKRKNKLQIDKRFAGVFQDARFQTGAGKYDKYGRRIEQKTNELKKFYQLDDDENDDDKNDDDAAATKSDSSDDDSSDDTKAASHKKSSTTSSASDDDEQATTVAKNDAKLTRLEVLNRMARGELADGNSDSDSDSSDDDSDSDAADNASESETEKEVVPMGEETKRFAVLNCDWSRIRAVDLFALCQSFAPATGAVHDVTIYPSDYGLQKMKEEEQFGPQGLWTDKKAKANAKAKTTGDDDVDGDDDDAATHDKSSDNEADSDSDSEDNDDAYDSDDPLGVQQRVDANDDNGFDSEKLRAYELQKLKYYYAVVTCDSVKTASAIFDACDQLEYEASANVLDLRFVPDDVTFTNAPKDTCNAVSETYKPALFATTALQNTDVTLTWEDGDASRLELLTRQSEWHDTADNDFAAYLASDNSDEDSGDNGSDNSDSDDDASDSDSKTSKPTTKKKAAKLQKLKSRYRKMLLGSDAEDDSDDNVNADNVDNVENAISDDFATTEGGDMEMTFTPGASNILKAKQQRDREAHETPFERYAREKKAQKNAKLHDKRAAAKAREREQKAVLQTKGRGSGATQAKLLREAVADTTSDNDDDAEDANDGTNNRNFDLKAIQKREKAAGLKGKRRAKALAKLTKRSSDALQQGFAFDAADPRFSALYARGSQFQLDPTDPKFKKTEANSAIFTERRKRTEQAGSTGSAGSAKAKVVNAETTGAESTTSELKVMVENLKRKAQQQHKTNAKKKQQRH